MNIISIEKQSLSPKEEPPLITTNQLKKILIEKIAKRFNISFKGAKRLVEKAENKLNELYKLNPDKIQKLIDNAIINKRTIYTYLIGNNNGIFL